MYTFQYHRHEIQLSDVDADLARAYRWRIIVQSSAGVPLYQVAASVASHPGDTRKRANVYLGQLVAARMGFPADRMTGHRDGSSLNCQRENLFAMTKRLPGRYGPVAKPLHNPRGLHRHAVGTSHPPQAYEFCHGPRDPQYGLCHERMVAAVAARVNRDSPLFRLWLPHDPQDDPWSALSPAVRFSELGNWIAGTGDADRVAAGDQEVMTGSSGPILRFGK